MAVFSTNIVVQFILLYFLVQTVYKCDFLNVEIDEPETSSSNLCDGLSRLAFQSPSSKQRSLSHLVANTFHVVIFSLLLEYLPVSFQRVQCVQTAWRLLQTDGLLVIVTPDSRRQHRNRRVAVDWRHDIESVGFERWRYEKLQHLHCMAFRKLCRSEGLGCPLSPDALRMPQDCFDSDDCHIGHNDGCVCNEDSERFDSQKNSDSVEHVVDELFSISCNADELL